MLDQGRLGAPTLWISEASNALWAKVMRRQLTPDEARKQAADLAEAPIVPIALPGLLPIAMKIALELEHPIYDCFLSFGSHSERYSRRHGGSTVLRESLRPACPGREGQAAQRLSVSKCPFENVASNTTWAHGRGVDQRATCATNRPRTGPLSYSPRRTQEIGVRYVRSLINVTG